MGTGWVGYLGSWAGAPGEGSQVVYLGVNGGLAGTGFAAFGMALIGLKGGWLWNNLKKRV